MPVLYPTEAIPTADRCPHCGGDGREWRVTRYQEDGPFWEPVGECVPCHGTGVTRGRPLPLPKPASFMPLASAAEVASWDA